MGISLTRVGALCLRYLLLHRRSLVRMFDIVFWPVLDLLVWGFLSLYIRQTAVGDFGNTIVFLVGALIGWDIHFRSQQSITISLMEEIWTRNLVNLLIAPIRLSEWVIATFLYGVLKVSIVAVLLSVISRWLYAFHVLDLGFTIVPLVASLLFFAWTVGLMTAGIVLRFGYAAEALIWGIPFLLQPFSCIFYPVGSLPRWARPIALSLPNTYVFEAMRATLDGRSVPATQWLVIGALNAVYFAGALVFFTTMFRLSRRDGRLGRLGQE